MQLLDIAGETIFYTSEEAQAKVKALKHKEIL
jgi:hypothetical protein